LIASKRRRARLEEKDTREIALLGPRLSPEDGGTTPPNTLNSSVLLLLVADHGSTWTRIRIRATSAKSGSRAGKERIQHLLLDYFKRR